jgi:hypothetical protein
MPWVGPPRPRVTKVVNVCPPKVGVVSTLATHRPPTTGGVMQV